MIRVRKIGHATFETPDMERLVTYYTQVLGLTLVERDADAAYLASTLDHHSVVLRHGAVARCARLSFQLAPDADLDAFKRQLNEHGIAAERRGDPQPSIADLVAFRDPKGTDIEVFAERQFAPQWFQPAGIVPVKLGHVAFNVTDIGKVVDFYVRVLGFRESDWMGDFFAFLRCGPDHHTLNFVKGKVDKMHHIAFELRDWAHVETACDLLARQEVPLIWGPGRHGIGHNIYTYHHDSDRQIVELFTELDRINDEDLGYYEPRPWHADRPQRPKVWEPNPKAANLWGVPPPPGFLD